ncbi:transcriptional regulator, TraR/DksA family [Amphritea atlantica]|uniref:Transcriptional regulator, TraR/DksA family n=1 Tax=Amphritea atlantica TaxID=355243 RepID=A0A1H9EFB2_9GAMM|nr:TraR/DksA C4-type zinc finger protein [Amphritea atlantica]SEQ24361.1 transcriptional regulator, TraR/DksA family [Amphritea atlantica]
MPDILDHAKELEMRQRQDALDNALKRSEPEQDIRDGVVICISCGVDIQPARLKAKPNAARCIHCQQIEEQKHGR